MDNTFKMGVNETGCDCVNWIHLAVDRGKWLALVNMIITLQQFTKMKEIF
jgi:hypothetical protein